AFLSSWIGSRSDFFDSARDPAARSAISRAHVLATHHGRRRPDRPTCGIRHEAPQTRSPCSRDLVECCEPSCGGVWPDQEREETSRCLGRSLLLLLAPCLDHPWHR